MQDDAFRTIGPGGQPPGSQHPLQRVAALFQLLPVAATAIALMTGALSIQYLSVRIFLGVLVVACVIPSLLTFWGGTRSLGCVFALQGIFGIYIIAILGITVWGMVSLIYFVILMTLIAKMLPMKPR